MVYHTLHGQTLQWDTPDAALQAFWDSIVVAWRNNAAWLPTFNRVYSVANPILQPTQGVVTQSVLTHPVFQSLMDLVDRLGIAQGFIGVDGTEDLSDPFVDTWISVPDAAQRKGVTVPGLHGAIDRGDVVARPRKPGGRWLEVSQRSLDRWTPDRVRQAARKQS